MAFISSGGVVISFCEYQDITERDQRLFEANEGLTETIVEDLAEKATSAILDEIRSTGWWARYWQVENNGFTTAEETKSYPIAPVLDPNRIRARTQQFTDLAIYKTLYEYLLPRIADFSAEDNAEVRKIGLYREKYQSLFTRLIEDGDWYDFDNDGTVEPLERMPTPVNLQRRR
jgi:hypothetical protein